MKQKFANLGRGFLAQNIDTVETQFYVENMLGVPGISAGEFFVATIFTPGSSYGSNIEIVKVVQTSGDYWTVERGQEETSAKEHPQGSRIELRFTAGSVLELQTTIDDLDQSKAENTDPRLSDAREWSAETVSQEEAESGVSTSRSAWTSQRVRQAANSAIAAKSGSVNGIATLNDNAKIPMSQLSDSILGKVEYMGIWNASTNTPTLPTTPAEKGYYYVVSVSGTWFDQSFAVGDWIISNGDSWDKVDNTGAVSSVNERTGNVTGLAESNDPRFTDSREWVVATVSQLEAETGTATTRRAFTAQRVRQAIVSWWESVKSSVVQTTGNQTIAGTKTFNGAINGTAVSTDATAGRLAKRDANGTFKVGVPTEPEHPVRLDYLGTAATRDVGLESNEMIDNEVLPLAIGTANLPRSAPTLNFNFMKVKHLDPRIEFTRGSTATYTDAIGNIRTAAIDEPRFTYDPVTGEALGLLVEEQRTNLLTNSESVFFGATTATNNTLNIGHVILTEVIENTDSTNRFRALYDQTGTFALSVFVGKQQVGEKRYIQFRTEDGSSVFSPSDGEVTREDFPVAVEDLGIAYRVSAVVSVTDEALVIGMVEHPDKTGGRYLGDGVSGLFVGGFQIEEGSQPSSYIPTEDSQVTRAGDTSSIPVTADWFNPNEGTFVVEGMTAVPDSISRLPLLKVGTGISHHFGLSIDRTLKEYRIITRDGSDRNTMLLGLREGMVKIAVAYTTGGNVRGSINGEDVVTTGNSWDGQAIMAWIGAGGIEGNDILSRRANGPNTQIAYFPRALSEAELQEITK